MPPKLGSDNLKGARELSEADALFTLDTKGDRQNLAYQSLHQASIPRYRTAGRGNIIGLHRGFRILRSSDTRRKVVASGFDSGVKQRQPSAVIAEPQPSQILRAPPEQTDIIVDQPDYVAITDRRSRKRRRLSTGGESDEDGVSDDSTHELLLASTTNGHDAFDNSVYQRQRKLAEQVSKQPDDIDAWCALIELQPDIVRTSADRHAQLTAAQHRTVSDLKISLYQEALSKAKDLFIQQRLIAGLMTEGSKVWDRGKQLAQCYAFIKQYPSFDLYGLYLEYVQTEHVDFSYDHCLQAYRNWLQYEVNKSDERDRDRHCLYVLLRLTTFMKQSGYSELATAIWQSMMEFNLCQPASTLISQALSALEDFWDTECARFGEIGARGWRSMTIQQPAVKGDPASLELQTKSLYHDWNLAEKNVATQASLPARTLDNASSDDPYRVVLFSDVREFLFELSSKESEPVLVDALLCFGGLPPVSRSSSWSGWQTDPFLVQTALPDNNADYTDKPAFTAPFTGVTDNFTIFTPSGPFSALPSPSQPTQLSQWARRGIEQLALSSPQEERLGVYTIALALHYDAASARKLSKRLIKQNQSGVKLYNAYALVECAVGNQAVSKNVWQTTLAMTAKSSDEDENDQLLVCWTRIFEALRQGNMTEASALLQSMSLDPPALDEPNIAKLRSREAFAKTEDLLQSSILRAISPPLTTRHDDLLVLSTDLLAILRYCQSNGDLMPPLETYRNILHLVDDKDFRSAPREALEIMHQHRSQLIHLHISSSRKAFEPKHILRTLLESVEMFPNNSIFVTLYDRYQRKYGLMDRLRGIASQALSDDNNDGVVQHMQTIHRELSTSEDLGTTEHSIRSAFSRAIGDGSKACHCLTTRLAHVRWEISLLNKQTSNSTTSPKQVRKQAVRAVQALHAALRACPWAKELYMLAFESEAMREALGLEGLKQVYETMIERGLRVHVDISDKIEQPP